MKVTGIHIGSSIAVKAIAKKYTDQIVNRHPLLLDIDNTNIAVFPFGVVIFWGVPEKQQQLFLEQIMPTVAEPQIKQITETVQVEKTTRPDFSDDRIGLPVIDTKQIVVISLVLARSIVLEKQESDLDALTRQLPQLTDRHKPLRRLSQRRLLQLATGTMNLHQSSTITVSMLETPDLVWNDTELCELYEDLQEEYEITDRHQQLTRKLDVLMKHSEFLLEFLHTKRALWLEITIVALIVVEIVLFVYDLWFAA